MQTYDPFGTPIASQPSNTTEHLFTGKWDKQYDTTSLLTLMGARPYAPTLGRFLAADPVDGGSLNNYDYAGQDPINGYDLDGNCYRDSATAYALNNDVAGRHSKLCRRANRIFKDCYAGYYEDNPNGSDLSDAQVIGMCWDQADKELKKNHPNLWQQERLHHGAVTWCDAGWTAEALGVAALAATPAGWSVAFVAGSASAGLSGAVLIATC